MTIIIYIRSVLLAKPYKKPVASKIISLISLKNYSISLSLNVYFIGVMLIINLKKNIHTIIWSNVAYGGLFGKKQKRIYILNYFWESWNWNHQNRLYLKFTLSEYSYNYSPILQKRVINFSMFIHYKSFWKCQWHLQYQRYDLFHHLR